VLPAPLIAAGLLLGIVATGTAPRGGATQCATLESVPLDLLAEVAEEPLITMETQPGSSLQVSTVVARIDAPIQVVFGVVTDHDAFARLFHEIRRSVTVGAKGTRRIVFMDVDMPFPVANRHYEIELDQARSGPADRPCWESYWRYLPGSGNIVDNHGRWELRGDGRVTWLAYVAYVDPGGHVPAWTVNWAARKALPRMIESVREEASKRLLALGAD
jgi:hypothetical protein